MTDHDPFRAPGPHRTFAAVTGAGKNPDPVLVTAAVDAVYVDPVDVDNVPDTAADVVDWIGTDDTNRGEVARRAAAAWTAELARAAGPRKTVATAVSDALAPDAPTGAGKPAAGDTGADPAT